MSRASASTVTLGRGQPLDLASPWVPAVIILAGLILRIAYILVTGPTLFLAEASNVAVAVAQGRGLADAYFVGSGPTAHLLPTTPVIAGAIMSVFGIRSDATQVILIAFTLAQTTVISVLLLRIFTQLKTPRAFVLGGLAASLWLPTMFSLDGFLFSCWDNGLAFIACLACISDLLSTWSNHDQGFGRMLRSALLLAVAAFFNPIFGVALAACTFLVRLIRSGFSSAVLAGTLTLLIFATIAAPWAWRNQQVLGSPIFLRSNAGLELAVANHDAALSSRPADEVFYERSKQIHPFADGPGRAELRRIGEPAYHNQLGRETREWIADNPAAFLQLCLRHMFRTLTPQAWQIGETLGGARALAITIACWSGVLALLWLLRHRRSEPWWIIALFLGTALLAYAPFQPMARYIYPFYQLLLFTAFAGAGAWLARGRTEIKEPQ